MPKWKNKRGRLVTFHSRTAKGVRSMIFSKLRKRLKNYEVIFYLVARRKMSDTMKILFYAFPFLLRKLRQWVGKSVDPRDVFARSCCKWVKSGRRLYQSQVERAGQADLCDQVMFISISYFPLFLSPSFLPSLPPSPGGSRHLLDNFCL